MPTPRSVDNIKSKLLHPALTSHFEVSIGLPQYRGSSEGFLRYLNENGVQYDQEKLNLLCSEASLPGSNLATFEINNDYTGVTERHVYRRIYDDRIDLTFYVDADNYLPIRFFESWIKYAVGENIGDGTGAPPLRGSANPNYFYRVRYPELYISKQGLTITKFERTNTTNKDGSYTPKSTLEYNFVNCFPISITSIPISYDTSSLLKCTVSISYIRYYINRTNDKMESNEFIATQGDASSPINQATFNSAPDYFLNPQFGVETLPVGSKSDITSQIRAAEIERSLGNSDAGNSFLNSYVRKSGNQVGRIGP